VSANLQITRGTDSVVTFDGRIDATNAETVLGKVGALVEPNKPLQLDVSALQSANSVTVSVLLALAAQAERRGGKIACINAPDRLRAAAHLCKAEALLGMLAAD
jgi:anti-anti-sigma factor